MTLRRFTFGELPLTAWKNGGGTTREIVSWPPYAEPDEFAWRVSIATIAASGPFSTFDGVDRTIMLLDGDGVRLRSEGFEEVLELPFQPFSFDGGVPVDCTLLGGPSTDFNLMVRRGQGRADLRIVEDTMTLEASAHGVLMCIEGQFRVGGGTLRQGQGIWWTEQEETWQVKSASRGARLAVVQWRSVRDEF